MPLKDRDEYNAYMRNKMRQYSAKKRAMKTMDKAPKEPDFDVTQAVIPEPDINEPLNVNSGLAKEFLEKAKEASKDPITKEVDPFFNIIEKGMKYLPLVIQAFKGFNEAASRYTQVQPNQPQGQIGVAAPAGWLTMTPLKRLNKKFTDPAWYEAGLRYDSFKSSGQVTSKNTSYVDSSYNQPAKHQEARTLKELQNKHPEPPLASGSAPTPQEPEFIKTAKANQNKEVEKMQPEPALVNALREDNSKYISMAFDYLKDLSMPEFEKYLNDLEALKPKISMLKMILPIHTKAMLKETSSDELLGVFKEKCPKKYKWVKDHKKVKEIKELFEELKGGL